MSAAARRRRREGEESLDVERPVTSLGSRGVLEEWLGAEGQGDRGIGLSKVGPQPIAKLSIDVRGSDLHQHVRA